MCSSSTKQDCLTYTDADELATMDLTCGDALEQTVLWEPADDPVEFQDVS